MKTQMDWMKVLETTVNSAGITRILLIGPPGTGKSTGPLTLFGAENVIRVQCTPGDEKSDALGTMGLKAGSTALHDGPVVRAMTEGKILVMDEADRLPRELESVLQSILDPKGLSKICLPDGREIEPAEGYKVICTSNQPDPLAAFSGPVADRFEVIIKCVEPVKAALDVLPAGWRKLVANTYTAQLALWNWAAPVSLRRATAYCRLEAALGAEMAGELCFGAAANEIISAAASAANQP